MSSRQRMIEALQEFCQAYYKLEKAWEDFDLDVMVDNTSYPFNYSFDELTIPDWIEDILEQLV